MGFTARQPKCSEARTVKVGKKILEDIKKVKDAHFFNTNS